ncbi:MAG TPA: hypothetical protein VLF94_07645, partial [Chlamydiales bacterium]|nr:hypothetical protein [Chlamydiales bacterium]
MAASVKDDWKIALMQRVLFDVGCPSRKQGMSCFSEKAMMKGVDGVVQVAKQVGVWPRVDLDKEKPYLPELKVHVKLLIKQLETEIS